ncbi:MAG: hypothetical protein K6U89_07645 [Chloroflexi bacterium]|nr:hypothetical protein [Chloroflexota bacterium]
MTQLVHRLVQKVLHPPSVRLRALAEHSPEATLIARAFGVAER